MLFAFLTFPIGIFADSSIYCVLQYTVGMTKVGWIYINTKYYFKKQLYRHYTDVHEN